MSYPWFKFLSAFAQSPLSLGWKYLPHNFIFQVAAQQLALVLLTNGVKNYWPMLPTVKVST